MIINFYNSISKVLSLLLPLIFIFCCINNSHGQSLSELENQLMALEIEHSGSSIKLDSLKTILSERAQLIDEAKANPDVEQDRVLDLMANSVSISNQIKLQEELLTQLTDEIESHKTNLNLRYTSILDSLKNIQNSGEDESINNSILYYTEKRLLVTPRISSLSFDPQKLLVINLTEAPEAFEKKILGEYFDNALNEVELYLDRVEAENEEVAEIYLLQKKAQQFLEDAEFDRNNRPLGVVQQEVTTTSSVEGSGSDFLNEREYQNSILLMPQLESYSKIMSQLSFINPSVDNNWQTALESAKENLSLPDYKQFLDQLKNRLSEYKLILSNKIKILNEETP